MLTPEQLDDAGESVAVVYRQIEAELLDYLTQNLIESDLSTQRGKTALNLLSQSMPQKVKAIIDEHADEIDQAVQDEVRELLEKSDRFDLARIAQDALGATVTAATLTAQTLAVTTSIRDLLARDNLALSEAARSKFLQWTTWATTQVATGNMAADKAMKKAVRELARGGLSIPFVTYKNEETGDTTVTNHVDVAIQRHLRSLIAQGSANLTMQRIGELDCKFVEVSSHIGSRPSHAEWQGRCYHVGGPKTVDGVTYEDFYEGTGYKGVAGPFVALGDQLLGVNCRHSFAPWVPGSPRAYSHDPEHPSGLSNDEVYQLTQKQRMRERAIRQTKREIAAAQRVYEAEPTPENKAEVSKLKIRLRTQQANMRKFIAEANAKGDPEHLVLTRQPRREWAGDMPKVATSAKRSKPSGAKAGGNVSSGLMTKEWLKQFENEELTATLADGTPFSKTGTPTSVDLTDADIATLKGATLRHTHTTTIGGTFSADDILITAKTEAPSHTVVATLAHEEFTLERTAAATNDSARMLADDVATFEQSAVIRACDEIWEAEYSKAEIPLDDAGYRKADSVVKSMLHEWLKANASKYGFSYTYSRRLEG